VPVSRNPRLIALLAQWRSEGFDASTYADQLEAALRPLPAELRNDERGQLDDVVIHDVKLFRLERMDKAKWWMRCYMHEGDDYVFHIETSGREITITAELEQG
jgi:hypothetical protein